MKDLPKNPASDVWVVVPALNESSRIGAVIHGLRALDLNVLVIDDGSTDDTFQVAIDHGAAALRHVINRGQGAAIQTGLDFTVSRRAKVIITFDADGQHNTKDIESLIEPILLNQADVVLGSRFLSGIDPVGLPKVRRLILKAGVAFTGFTTGMDLTDTHNGIRAFSLRAARQIKITEDRMSHASDLLQQVAAQKLRYTECPVSINYSDESLAKGQSNSAAISIFARLILSKLMQ